MHLRAILLCFASLACGSVSASSVPEVIHPRRETAVNGTALSAECRKLEAIRNQTEALFTRPITREEYYQRNWMWVRCRTKFENMFDAGGSWFGPKGRDLRDMIDQKHRYINWQFKYVNGLGWGDAMFQFHYVHPKIDLEDTVVIMRKVAKAAADRYQREFYLWDCPGAKDDPNWDSETAGKPKPADDEDSKPRRPVVPPVVDVDPGF